MRIEYRALNRAGTEIAGRATVEDLTAWVEAKHAARWQKLEAWRVGEVGGEPVAAIVPHPDTGRRTWWAEKD